MTAFIDKAKIKIISGAGGNGAMAWRREKYVDKGGPAGGDGGKGGDVYFIATSDMSTLLDFTHKSVYKAERGENGQNKNCHGKNGKDLYIKMPVGVIVKDLKTNKLIADLNKDGKTVLMAKGGRGGRGNARFATSQKRAPQFCEPGEPSIERELELELKLLADVGLVGMPNAGKSSLISVISAAKPKIADYPFTTLTPNLGVVKKPQGDGFVVADIPGLIEGASDGLGLGHEFLRHVQRCKLLLHVVDISKEDSQENYEKINKELQKYNEELSTREQILVLNKLDLVDFEHAQEIKKEFCEKYSIKNNSFIISTATQEGIKDLLNYLYTKLEEIEDIQIELDIEEDFEAFDNDDSDFEIEKLNKNTYNIIGGKLKRLASVTDIRNTQQIKRFTNILDSMGVYDKLRECGVQNGDTIIVSGIELSYDEEYY
ncbi:MAG: GTPase ObgE [Candidatus Gastranaerophilales bacterium]|nr:GTPase ObgE [Candidatus Gastranaerophilales bacterium]